MHIYVENQRGERFLVSEGWSSSPTVFDNDFSADLLATFPPAVLDQIFDRFLAHGALVTSFGHAEVTQDLLHTQQFPGLPAHFSRDHIEVYTAVRQRRILVEEAPLGEPVLDERQTSLRSRIRMALQKIIAEERAEAARIDAVHQKRNELEKLGAQVSQVAKGLGQAGWDLVVWTKDIAEVALLVNPIRMQTQLASATYDYYAHDKSFEDSSREYMGKVKKEIVDVLGFDPSTITVEQLEQAFEVAHLVYDDDGLRSDISRFAKDYVKAQHSLEISEFAGGGVFEIILTIVLAAFTGGVGGAAAMAKNARLMFRFKDVGDLILDFAKYQKQRRRLSKTRGAKSEGTSFKTLKSEEVSVPQSPASDAPASKPAGAKKAKENDKGAKDKDAEKKSKPTNAKDRSNEDTGVNGDGKATQCNGKACESGEPINLKTGEERLTLVDAVLDGPLPLTVARTYRSSNHTDSGLGVGWSHTLGEKLVVQKGKGIVELHDAEGRRISLPLPGESDRSHNVVEQLSVTRHAEDHWVISPYGAPEGVQKHFRLQESGQGALLLSEIRDGYDNFHRFHYAHGQLICVESSLGEALHITPAGKRIGELKKETRDGRLTSLASYAYSEQGDLVRATDADGHSEEYAYQGHLISQRTLKSGYRFHFQWDDTGPGARCLRQWGDPIDGQATYDYSFVWDEDGNGVAATDTRGGTERYRFNERGLPIYYRNAEGGETLYTYNALGQPLSIQLPAETGITREEHYEYDSRGRLIRKTDAAGGEQHIEYSPAGLPAKITDAAGRSWQREYNASGQVVATIDPLGNTTRYSYNPIGLVGSVTDPLDNTTRYLWNPQGKLSAVQDPEGRATHYKYDIQQRLVEVQQGADLRTGYEYDAQDRISAIINPDGARTEYRYNPQGLVAEIIDPEGRSTRYSYDGLSQVKSRTNPDGSELKYLYDGERNLVGLINEKGERYQLKY
ncbi:DUF6531 domain-containing protein, partial [Microbulbifer mangrovi]|uniref:DUF6531 domain-containing protein n=1 Tax=Microbulbifer mangrovi TaxID=927787 RepID=UPI00117E1413